MELRNSGKRNKTKEILRVQEEMICHSRGEESSLHCGIPEFPIPLLLIFSPPQ